MASWISFACLAQNNKGGLLEDFPSQLLGRKVPIALHIPESGVIQRWKANHPSDGLRLVLFLPGIRNGPKDLIKQGIVQDLQAREKAGELPPALWVAVTHFRSWYADRKDGTFPYERFLIKELLPALEKRYSDFGGSPQARTVVGFSMGGFGAINLSARTGLFGRCAALSPALVEAPFDQVAWWIRGSLRATFPISPQDYNPWNPWKHLGGNAKLWLGCGTEDKYNLAELAQTFADLCQKRQRPVILELSPGDHNWDYWTPTLRRLMPWIHQPESDLSQEKRSAAKWWQSIPRHAPKRNVMLIRRVSHRPCGNL